MNTLTSVADIDLTPPANRTYWTCGREWREEFIYFLLVDRFHDGRERTPHPFEQSTKLASPEQLSRFCRGKLNGIRKHLDYIKNLECTVLWLSPVLENNDAPDPHSQKYHGYAIQNYLYMDPRSDYSRIFNNLSNPYVLDKQLPRMIE